MFKDILINSECTLGFIEQTGSEKIADSSVNENFSSTNILFLDELKNFRCGELATLIIEDHLSHCISNIFRKRQLSYDFLFSWELHRSNRSATAFSWGDISST